VFGLIRKLKELNPYFIYQYNSLPFISGRSILKGSPGGKNYDKNFFLTGLSDMNKARYYHLLSPAERSTITNTLKKYIRPLFGAITFLPCLSLVCAGP